jgi:hypothetical protein
MGRTGLVAAASVSDSDSEVSEVFESSGGETLFESADTWRLDPEERTEGAGGA